jgi:hypothetical protein
MRIPNADPAGRMGRKMVGKAVAAMTVRRDVKGRLDAPPPPGASERVRIPPAVTSVAEVASARTSVEREIASSASFLDDICGVLIEVRCD